MPKHTMDDAERWQEEQYEKDPEMRERVAALRAAMDVEDQLVALREARGLSQSALAARLGVSQPRIAKLEGGDARNIELRTLLRYVAALGGKITISIKKDPAWAKVVPMRRAARRAAG